MKTRYLVIQKHVGDAYICKSYPLNEERNYITIMGYHVHINAIGFGGEMSVLEALNYENEDNYVKLFIPLDNISYIREITEVTKML